MSHQGHRLYSTNSSALRLFKGKEQELRRTVEVTHPLTKHSLTPLVTRDLIRSRTGQQLLYYSYSLPSAIVSDRRHDKMNLKRHVR